MALASHGEATVVANMAWWVMVGGMQMREGTVMHGRWQGISGLAPMGLAPHAHEHACISLTHLPLITGGPAHVPAQELNCYIIGLLGCLYPMIPDYLSELQIHNMWWMAFGVAEGWGVVWCTGCMHVRSSGVGRR